MATNTILRPNASGQYSAWDGFVTVPPVTPHTPLWDLIHEVTQDGDSRFISTSTSGSFTVLFTSSMGGSWPRATRIPSIRVVATVRTTGVSAEFRFRLRSFSTDYDTVETYTVTSASYVEVGHTYNLLPNGRAWDLSTLNRLEAGLVFVSGDELRCTKLEIFVHYETFPHFTLAPDAAGAHQDWLPVPATSPVQMVVNGVYDGDLSYLADSGPPTNISTFEFDTLPAALTPANIDRISTKALVKNVGTVPEVASVVLRSAGLDFMGATNTTGVIIQPDSEWHMLSEEYLNDPGLSWPSGNPAGIPWVVGTVNAVELGIENSGGGDFRSTAMAIEVWLAATPPTTINLYPTADGTYTDWTTLVPGAPAWGTVDEVVPDDAASYLVLDATAAGTPQYASFTVGGAGAVPAGERIYNVEARYRIRLGNLPHTYALIAPVTRVGGETYVGRPLLIEGMAGTWFDAKWDFPVEPSTGLPWATVAAVTSTEFGFAVLEGAALLSRLRAQVQTIADYRGTPDATDFKLTDAAEGLTGLIARSRAEGLIYAITEFAVGTDGYDPTDPSTVDVVVPSATALGAELYRSGIGRIEFDGASEPQTVDYWCRVPQAEAQGGLGEFGLFAEILRSPVDPTEVGDKYLFSLAHHPCQTRHWDAAQFYLTQFQYPTASAELLVDGDMEEPPGVELVIDGDMEAVGVAAWLPGSGTLTKELGSPGGTGTQVLRVTKDGVPVDWAEQADVTIGKCYRTTGWARGDATSNPIVGDNLGFFWTGTTSVLWQAFDTVFYATSVQMPYLYASGGNIANWVEFDDVSVREQAADWTATNNAALSKETGTPHSGTYCLRVAFDGIANPSADQTVLTAYTLYRIVGWARGDAAHAPAVLVGTTVVWTGLVSTAWQPINVLVADPGTTVALRTVTAVAGYSEFDDFSVVQPYDVIYGAELLVDGDMEAVGVAAWTAVGGALTKTVVTPYQGLQVLRNTGVAGDIARQTVLTIGTMYYVTGRTRSDGTSVPRVLETAGAVWTGTTSTAWQPINTAFVATGATLDFEISAGAGYAEFDICSVVEVVG